MASYITEIIIAVIAFAGTLAGSLIAYNKTQAVIEEQIKDIRNDIGTLSARVDKHNSLIERTAVLESKVERLEREG